MKLTKEQLAKILAGEPVPSELTTPEAEEVSLTLSEAVSGEVVKEQDEETEITPIKVEKVRLPEDLYPKGDEVPSYVTGELEWSRSFNYNKISLRVRMSVAVKRGREEDALEHIVASLDSKVRQYAYGVAEKELDSWS